MAAVRKRAAEEGSGMGVKGRKASKVRAWTSAFWEKFLAMTPPSTLLPFWTTSANGA